MQDAPKSLQEILEEKKEKMELAPTIGEQQKLQREINVLQQEIDFQAGN